MIQLLSNALKHSDLGMKIETCYIINNLGKKGYTFKILDSNVLGILREILITDEVTRWEALRIFEILTKKIEDKNRLIIENNIMKALFATLKKGFRSYDPVL